MLSSCNLIFLVFLNFVIVINGLSTLDTKNDENLVGLYAFSCSKRLFIVQLSVNPDEFVQYVNLELNRQVSDDKIDLEEKCDLMFSDHHSINSNGPTNDRIKMLMDLHGDNKAYLYLHNQSPYDLLLYQMSIIDYSMAISHSGCVHIQNTAANSSFFYNSLKKAKLYFYDTTGEYSYDNPGPEDKYCQRYFNALKSDQDTFSPFHGHPIVMVPGLISSEIYGQSDNPACSMAKEKRQMWFQLFNLLSASEWLACLKLEVNEQGESSNYGELFTDTSNWGHPDSIKKFETERFYQLTEKLMSWGYEPGVSARAAPYDWRKAPNESEEYYIKFKNLIEETYYMNNNKKVVLLAHSMGNLFSLYFLNRMTQEWKDKYLKSFICIAGPFGGSVAVLKLIMRGEVDHLYYVRSYLKPVGETLLSALFLMPNDNLFNATEPLVIRPSKNYSIQNYDELFHDLNLDNMIPAYAKVKNLIRDLTPPELEVHCIYGTGKDTDRQYIFKEDEGFPETASDMVYVKGDGDATVSTQSAKGCLTWRGRQKKPVFEMELHKVEHSELLIHEDVHDYLKTVMFKPN